MKKAMLLVRSALLISLLLSLSGCVAAIGNREPARFSATPGQQLVDLKKAYDAGALNEAEYHAQRAKVLDAK